MTVDDRVELVQAALSLHGDGFLAWLIRGRADYSDPEFVERFADVYAGWYPDRRTFLAHELIKLDWLAEKDAFLDVLGLPPGALEIDEGCLWEHLQAYYATEERLGGVHVFLR